MISKLWFGIRDRKEFQSLSDDEFDDIVVKINEIIDVVNEEKK